MQSRSLAILITTCLTVAAVRAQKFPDVRVDSGTATSTLPTLAAAEDRVFVAWQDWRNNAPAKDLYFNRSLDAGQTWQPDDRLMDTNTDCQAIAVQGSHVYLAWHATDGIWFNRSTDDGATWLTSPTRLDRNVGFVFTWCPQIAAVGDAVFVVWPDRRNGNEDIYFNRSLDGGATWLVQDVRLDTGDTAGATRSLNPQIAATAAGVFVVWPDARTGLNEAYFNRSLDAGATWLPTDRRLNTSLPPGQGFATWPIVVAEGSSVHVTWYGGLPFNVFYNRSLDAGTTWLPSEVQVNDASSTSVNSQHPVIAVDGGTVYFAWEDQRSSSSIHTNRTTDNGATFLTDDIRLDGAGFARSYAPRIAASNGGVHVTWWEQTGCWDVQYNRSYDGGSTWLDSPLRLDNGDAPGASCSKYPEITVSGDAVHIAWADLRNGDADLYVNIPLGFAPYGSSKAGSGGIPPSIGGSGRATLGETVSIDVSSGLGGTSGALLVGAARTSVPILGGELSVLPILSVPIALSGPIGQPGAGDHATPIPIPALLPFLGAQVNFQAVLIDAGASFGASMTSSIEMWIG